MAKEISEEQRQEILDAVSKFLNRDNLYSSIQGGKPTINIKKLAGLDPYDITCLFFEYNINDLNVYYLNGENTIIWKRAVLPMKEFPEAYKMFLDKYEKLDGEKIPKEEIEKYRKVLEMWKDKKYEETQKKIETELIINNAFEFLKRDDLVLKGNNITLPLSEERKIKKDYTVNQLCYNGIRINIFYIKNKTLYFLYEYTNKDLIELFNKKLNELQAKQQQTEQPHRETLEETRKWREEQEKQYKDNAQPQETTDYTIKYDQNKPKLSQFPREAMEAVVEVMEYGARKYGKGTWSRVEAQRYIDAGARHLYAMQDIDENGKEFINFSKVDEESGLEHLYHLACNVVYAVALYKRGKDETR